MRGGVLNFQWHEQKPVYSLSFHPAGLLATAGGDKVVNVWQITPDNQGLGTPVYLSSLSGHTGSVNVVRFSPSGTQLASGGDGGELCIWAQDEDGTDLLNAPWRRKMLCRGHGEDVQDLAWSADGSALASGSVENLCIVWDAATGKGKIRLEKHKHYVQGVAWDPLSAFLMTLSADRTCKVYAAKGKAHTCSAAQAPHLNVVATISRLPPQGKENAAEPSAGASARPMLFHDDSLPTFFRRLAWAPDGSMAVLPTGIQQAGNGSSRSTAWVFARGRWACPAFSLPTPKPIIAAAFCPCLFKLPEGREGDAMAGMVQLPYNMVFALATLDSLLIYSTQAMMPLAVLGNVHLDRITDLSWSADGLMLAASSYDGFCSLARFEPGELGNPLPDEALPAHLQAAAGTTAKFQKLALTLSEHLGTPRAAARASAEKPRKPKDLHRPKMESGEKPQKLGVAQGPEPMHVELSDAAEGELQNLQQPALVQKAGSGPRRIVPQLVDAAQAEKKPVEAPQTAPVKQQRRITVEPITDAGSAPPPNKTLDIEGKPAAKVQTAAAAGPALVLGGGMSLAALAAAAGTKAAQRSNMQ